MTGTAATQHWGTSAAWCVKNGRKFIYCVSTKSGEDPAGKETLMILVTGASGLIGKRLVRALAERAELQVLIRDQTPSPFSNIEHVRVCRGDISDYAAVERAFSGVTEVIHLAAAMHGSEREYIDGTLRGTENVIRCCLEKQVNKLLYMSSLSVLSLSKIPYEAVADESWEYEPLPERRGLYSKYKLLAEQCVVDAVRRHSLPACILRPTDVLQRDAPHLSFATGFKIGTMMLSLIDKRANVPLIEIDDLVSVMLRLLDVCDFRGRLSTSSIQLWCLSRSISLRMSNARLRDA